MAIEKLAGNVSNLAGIATNSTSYAQQDGAVFDDILASELSLEEQIKARSEEKIAGHNAALKQKEAINAREEFLEFMGKDSTARVREQVLLALGITEEDLEAMTPEERRKTEQKISAMIEEKIRLSTEEELEKSAVADAGESSLEAAAAAEAQEEPVLSGDDARKDDWLAALGIPQDGRLQVGFNAFGELKIGGKPELPLTAGVEEIL